MRISKILLTLTAIVGMALLWTGCQKEVSKSAPENNQLNAPRLGGLAPDDQNRVIKVPLMMSSDLMKSGEMVSTSGFSAEARGKKPGGGTLDTQPPAVSITSPANGASVSGIVNVTVSATDNVGVASVKLSVDGTVYSTIFSAPYSFSWNSDNVADGTHTLTATAKDAAGNSASASISVAKNTVINTPPPTPTLPSSLSLTAPPVGNQGNEFTCTPFAAVYGARSIEQFYRSNASSYSQSTNIFSVEYVYDQTKAGSCSGGTSITSCLDLMYGKGVCTNATMPYSDINGCDVIPTSAQNAEAANYKIANYSKIINTDITSIKTMLYYKHPVIASLNVDNNFVSAGPGFIWSALTASSGTAPHCITIVGYDDSKNAYKILNSWGTSWGDAGFSWIDYSFFPTKAGYYTYVMNY